MQTETKADLYHREKTRNMLHQLLTGSALGEAAEMLKGYKLLILARTAFHNARSQVIEFEHAYAAKRKALVVAAWEKRGVAFCTQGHHMAPKDEMRIVALKTYTRRSTDEGFDFSHRKHSNIQRICGACEAELQTSFVAVKGKSDGLYLPLKAVMVKAVRVEEAGVSIESDFEGDWSKPDPTIEIPDAIPDSHYESFLVAEDNIPPTMDLWRALHHKDESLRVGNYILSDEELFDSQNE